MVALVDTNVLVYAHDPRHSEKQSRAASLLSRGIKEDSVRIPHQGVVEFVAATTRSLGRRGAILSREEACRAAEEFLSAFTVLYPNERIVRTALRGMAAYQLSWFDAHMWAYAEEYGIGELLSEDFQHDRLYGTVRVVNPFLDA